MKVTVFLEYRFDRTPDGTAWTQTTFSYPFWRRYLEVFSQVNVVARAKSVAEPPERSVPVTGDGVVFSPLPHYIGPAQYVLRSRRVRTAARAAAEPGGATILRVPSTVAAAIDLPFRRRGRPYAVEVVGDPMDVFAPGAVRHPLRPLFRIIFARRLRRQCRHACAAAYVTRSALQRRYPPGTSAFSTHYSSLELPDEGYVERPRDGREPGTISIVSVGTLEQLYKAPDVLIDAIAACRRSGLDLKATFVGDGRYRPMLERRVQALGLDEFVRFVGQLPAGPAVRDALDAADLFVLPSRVEGLPRAMIEAMARGLPCLGSTAGGIPELLPAEDLVTPGDVAALADRILEIARDPDRRARMSARNLRRAQEYRDDLLQARRIEFYRRVRDATAAWLAKGRT